MSRQIYTQDHTTVHSHMWMSVLSPFAGKPGLNGLEIGALEGRTSNWFLSSILTHPTSKLTCVDVLFNIKFFVNTAANKKRLRTIESHSQEYLRKLPVKPTFDFVYIDGSHRAKDCLEDAILSWALLKKDGIVIFDDYLHGKKTMCPETERPEIAINSFIKVYADQMVVLHKDWQVIVKKTVECEQMLRKSLGDRIRLGAKRLLYRMFGVNTPLISSANWT